MKVQLIRTRETHDSTVGRLAIDGHQVCLVLEDGFRSPKVPGETRIPAGTYRLKLRNEGGLNARYLARFGSEFHKGMVQITSIPNFEFVMIHCGNTVGDTEGCPLVGSEIVEPGGEDDAFAISGSEKAYRVFYPQVRDALLAKQDVSVIVSDPPKPEPLVS